MGSQPGRLSHSRLRLVKVMTWGDVDLRGKVVHRGDDIVVFRDDATGKKVTLPREHIAIIEEVEGQTVSMPKKLAKAKGLI